MGIPVSTLSSDWGGQAVFRGGTGTKSGSRQKPENYEEGVEEAKLLTQTADQGWSDQPGGVTDGRNNTHAGGRVSWVVGRGRHPHRKAECRPEPPNIRAPTSFATP